jgi:PRTRC genetic system protein A
MPSLNLVSARLADASPTGAMCEYIVAGNGIFVRAEDSRMRACIPIARVRCPGLPELEWEAQLKGLRRLPGAYLHAILASARRRLPNEAAYQIIPDGPLPWRIVSPEQTATPGSVDYADQPEAVIDVHSHGHMAAFWSLTDDADEQGLRFYCVIGNIHTEYPTLLVRVGVYGHHWPISAASLFDDCYPFVCGKETE